MKVAIIGSRNCPSNRETYSKIVAGVPLNCTEIVSGGAKGIDAFAERYAKEFSLRLKVFPPDYDQFGKKAPLMRNIDIVRYSDYIIAFWDGASRGTAFVVATCIELGKPVKIIRF